MPRAPDVIVVARHGARLDAADREWHLSSPTPYDPPLTYGGWNQSKALGLRIASLLHARALRDPPGGEASQPQINWKRRYRIIVHTSPFLRCIETSIAIGAGIEQFETPGGERRRRRSSVHRRQSRPAIEEETETEGDDDNLSRKKSNGLRRTATIIRPFKPLLRVDAFLGEWYTREYYEDITAPPESSLMLAGAKAELLRQEQIDIFQPSAASKGHFPGGWSKGGVSVPADVTNTRPRVYRSNTHNSFDDSTDSRGHKEITSTFPSSSATYVAPVPAYAVSPIDTIPKGYVVHARDACVDVDLQWDSMREPQDWGDGGELGESWSALQRRIRTGISKMISWYKAHDAAEPTLIENTLPSGQLNDEDPPELVLVLVTHSAGCNALIGALTNQPVLIDVGMASLTMAARKTDANTGAHQSFPSDGGDPSAPLRRRSSVDFGLSEEYEMQLMASTSHLRAAAEASRATALQSPNLVPQIPEFGRTTAVPTSIAQPIGLSYRPNNPRPINSALGSMRRSNNAPSTSTNPSAASSRSTSGSSAGLWSASRQATIATTLDLASDVPSSAIDDLSLGPSVNEISNSPIQETFEGAVQPAAAPVTTGHNRTGSGLWGQGMVAKNPQIARVQASKRRWTMSENDG